MVPTIRDGDWLFVDHLQSVRAGDVAVIDRSGSVVVHRVISRRLGLEMGDACPRGGRFEAAGVRGRVVAVARGDRTIDMTSVASRLRGHIWTLRGLGKIGFRKLHNGLMHRRNT